jgi:hypothetical protein
VEFFFKLRVAEQFGLRTTGLEYGVSISDRKLDHVKFVSFTRNKLLIIVIRNWFAKSGCLLFSWSSFANGQNPIFSILDDSNGTKFDGRPSSHRQGQTCPHEHSPGVDRGEIVFRFFENGDTLGSRYPYKRVSRYRCKISRP